MPGPKIFQQNIGHSIKSPLSVCFLPIMHPGTISSPGKWCTCIWPFKWCTRKHGDQVTFFHCSIVQQVWLKGTLICMLHHEVLYRFPNEPCCRALILCVAYSRFEFSLFTCVWFVPCLVYVICRSLDLCLFYDHVWPCACYFCNSACS